MRVLFDLLHPAHVHVFRNAIGELRAQGHEVIVTSRDKDQTLQLLDACGIPHRCLSRMEGGKLGLLLELLLRAWRLIGICRRQRPDVMVGIMGAVIAPVGRLMGIPTHTYYDTEMATLTNRYVYRLTDAFITPECYTAKVPPAIHRTYRGYHELAYLHPDRFLPDPTVLEDAGLQADECFFVLRFVSWGASHDIGHSGLTLDVKRRVVEMLRPHGRVIITSEGALPEFFEPYRMRLAPERIHHLLHYAHLLYGESGTMASEAAVLGTHAFFINSQSLGYLEDQERHGLVFNYRTDATSVEDSLKRLAAMAADPDLRNRGQAKARTMVAGMVDVTAHIVNTTLSAAPNP